MNPFFARRMMMIACNKWKEELFNIETARIETESWRNIEYTVSDGAITITKASYSWSSVYVYLDRCIQGRQYRISFMCSTERDDCINCNIKIDDNNNIIHPSGEHYEYSFECGSTPPKLGIAFSTNTAQTIPVTYYDFLLEEI